MHKYDDTGDKLEHACFCCLADRFERGHELLGILLQTISSWRKCGTWGTSIKVGDADSSGQGFTGRIKKNGRVFCGPVTRNHCF